MKRLPKSLLIASLLSVGITATALTPIATNIVNAQVNVNFGLSNIGVGTVTVTVPNAQLYDVHGNPLSRALPQGSKWKTYTQNTLNNGTYYQVSSTEYVRSSDVNLLVETPGIAENNDQSLGQISITDTYDGLIITTPNAQLYDMNGHPLSRALNQGTAWKVGIQNNINSGTYYSVSNTEFVKASDARLYQKTQAMPTNEVVTVITKDPAPIYDINGQIKPGRALLPGTNWKTNAYFVIGKSGYYRVATDEFVSATNVQ